jgi:hypothetical protein
MDWVTISALATAFGTLVLAIATFASTRSATRAAGAAERSLAAGLRPLLISSREQDPSQKVGFIDQHYARIDGGRGSAELTDDVIYLVMSLRNVGAGVAVLHSWGISTDAGAFSAVTPRPDPAGFHRLTRDIYVPASDVGFWQGALRDPNEESFAAVRYAIQRREPITVYLLYGDVEGGQRVISRFALVPAGDTAWLANVARHWNLDHPDPR